MTNTVRVMDLLMISRDVGVHIGFCKTAMKEFLHTRPKIAGYAYISSH